MFDMAELKTMNPQYFFGTDARQNGPVSLDELRTMVARGELKRTDRVWRSGQEEWRSAGDFEEIFRDMPPDFRSPRPIAEVCESHRANEDQSQPASPAAEPEPKTHSLGNRSVSTLAAALFVGSGLLLCGVAGIVFFHRS